MNFWMHFLIGTIGRIKGRDLRFSDESGLNRKTATSNFVIGSFSTEKG